MLYYNFKLKQCVYLEDFNNSTVLKRMKKVMINKALILSYGICEQCNTIIQYFTASLTWQSIVLKDIYQKTFVLYSSRTESTKQNTCARFRRQKRRRGQSLGTRSSPLRLFCTAGSKNCWHSLSLDLLRFGTAPLNGQNLSTMALALLCSPSNI